MNTRLLSIIQSERERRNAPAVLALNKQKGRESPYEKTGFGKLWIVLRGVKDAFNLLSQLDTLKDKQIILPGKGHKHDEVEKELVAAGIKSRQISKTGDQNTSIETQISTMFLVAGRLARSYPLIKAKHTFKYFEILFLYIVLCKWLQKKDNPSAWIIIGDLTSSLISLSAACKRTGETVVYWQYSFLDFKHLPVEADIAVILNNTGIQLSKISADKPYYWRDIGSVKSVDTQTIRKGPVGVLLNVLAHDKAWDTIAGIQNEIGLPCVVRFHPNSKLAVPELPKEITISDKSEPLEAFTERISLAVCGNTQAQAKVMMMGVPVVQLYGLDLLDYDFHEYIQRDIVPGIKKPENFDFEQIVSFYHSEKYKTGLFNLIGPTGEDRVPGLEALVDSLTKEGPSKESLKDS